MRDDPISKLTKEKARMREYVEGVHEGMTTELTEMLRNDVLASGVGSPVESGRFSASIRASVGAAEGADKPRSAGHVIGSGRSIQLDPIESVINIVRFKIGDTIVIGNSLRYGPKIEFGGHSRFKAPAGVHGPTSARFRTALGGKTGLYFIRRAVG